MPCVSPLYAVYGTEVAPSGKRRLLFTSRKERELLPAEDASVFPVPCGQCWSCRLEYSRQWAIRCLHESKLHSENSFITLTYSPEFLPQHGSLDGPVPDRPGVPGKPGAFALFMKRLRKSLNGGQVRYYHAGEYGDLFRRPHYHACLFGFDFGDKLHHAMRSGFPVWRSATLEKLWPFGYSEIGSVTFESAAYVARYIMKKAKGEDAKAAAYSRVEVATGEIVQVEPEYVTMSRRPGIGAEYYRRYKEEIYRHDSIVVRGREMNPPRFYDGRFEVENPEAFDRIKCDRQLKRKADDTLQRRRIEEMVKVAKVSLTRRALG